MQDKLIAFLYRSAQAIALPFLLLYFLWRGLRDPRYWGRIGERFGFLGTYLERTPPGAIWLHAVSVGEVITAVGLVRVLRQELPGVAIVVSTSTIAGRAAAEEKLGTIANTVFYAPIDYCFAVRKVLRRLRPALVVVLETEIWPNLFREAKRHGAKLIVVNGRISDRTIERYRALRWFFGSVLAQPDAILAQSEADRGRYVDCGAPLERVSDAGNLKYDFDPADAAPVAAVRALIERLRPAEVWIAASTMPPSGAGDVDEDDVVIRAFQQLAVQRPGLLALLVPRRPERFDGAAGKLAAAGVRFLRRSQMGPQDELALPGVLLVDTIGELSGLYALADVVFMGGTLAKRGGHNILEPAFFARPIIVGPHMENFAAIAREFRAGAALRTIAGADALADAVAALLDDSAAQLELGTQARRLAETRRGATGRALEQIRTWQAQAVPYAPRPLPARVPLWLVARLWEIGGRWRRTRELAGRVELSVPVISIGGIAMGGSGKTPFVAWLAGRLAANGCKPAILTRGYRRARAETATILAAGEQASIDVTGDEAQILLRRGTAALGIGADRAQTGQALIERLRPDVILLDDGFQHARLARKVDIVVIDALDPFAGGDVFPLGRLREPASALARADALVVARTEVGRGYEGLLTRLRQCNSHAPVFLARSVPERWHEVRSGATSPPAALPYGAVAAFCGLGNPDSFWLTLVSLVIQPRWRVEFADHHRYSPDDVRRLAERARESGVAALLTTEKDRMNLDAASLEALGPLDLCWLEIGTAVENEDELLRLIEQRSGLARRPRAAL